MLLSRLRWFERMGADLPHLLATFPTNMRSDDTAMAPARRRLLMFHGLASSPKEFGLLFHPLRRLGIDLICPEVPGYSHGTLSRDASWSDWVAQARQVVDRQRAESDAPMLLGGLCTGAMLALALMGRAGASACPAPAGVEGLVLLSPLFAYDGWALPVWYRLRHLAYALGLSAHFSMRERAPYGLKNERMRQRVRQQLEGDEASLVGPAAVSLRFVRESERLSREARRQWPGLDLPMLAIHAREDEICSLASARRALSAARPGTTRVQVLENSYHMITADNDRLLVAELMADFIRDVQHRRPIGAVSLEPVTAPRAAHADSAFPSFTATS